MFVGVALTEKDDIMVEFILAVQVAVAASVALFVGTALVMVARQVTAGRRERRMRPQRIAEYKAAQM